MELLFLGDERFWCVCLPASSDQFLQDTNLTNWWGKIVQSISFGSASLFWLFSLYKMHCICMSITVRKIFLGGNFSGFHCKWCCYTCQQFDMQAGPPHNAACNTMSGSQSVIHICWCPLPVPSAFLATPPALVVSTVYLYICLWKVVRYKYTNRGGRKGSPTSPGR